MFRMCASALVALGRAPRQADGLALDRDAALALDVHAVEVLGAHLALLDHPGDLEHAVGERRLAVVDVGDDAEVPDQRGVGRAGLRDLRSGRTGRGHAGGTSTSWCGGRSSGSTAPIVPRTAGLQAPRPAGGSGRFWACGGPLVPFQVGPGSAECGAGCRSHPPISDRRGSSWRTSSPRSSGSRRTRRRACATRRSSPRSRRRSAASARPLPPVTPTPTAAALTRRLARARQGRQQGRHPQEPGREPQVGARQAGREGLSTTRLDEGAAPSGSAPSCCPAVLAARLAQRCLRVGAGTTGSPSTATLDAAVGDAHRVEPSRRQTAARPRRCGSLVTNDDGVGAPGIDARRRSPAAPAGRATSTSSLRPRTRAAPAGRPRRGGASSPRRAHERAACARPRCDGYPADSRRRRARRPRHPARPRGVRRQPRGRTRRSAVADLGHGRRRSCRDRARSARDRARAPAVGAGGGVTGLRALAVGSSSTRGVTAHRAALRAGDRRDGARCVQREHRRRDRASGSVRGERDVTVDEANVRASGRQQLPRRRCARPRTDASARRPTASCAVVAACAAELATPVARG